MAALLGRVVARNGDLTVPWVPKGFIAPGVGAAMGAFSFASDAVDQPWLLLLAAICLGAWIWIYRRAADQSASLEHRPDLPERLDDGQS